MPPSFSITLEEHVVFPSLGSDRPSYNDIWKVFSEAKRALEDHSTGRIADLDEGHVSFQIMSHLPGMSNHNVDGCRKANDEMAEAIKKNSNRLGGFASLPMASPDKAAAEVERAVKELGLLGAMIDTERLDVPLYIHPGPPEDTRVKEMFSGSYSEVITQGLSTGAWGWHEDVGLHVVKLYSAGVFARFPGLKHIIGHMGEMIPMMIDRTDSLKFYEKSSLGRFRDVWDRNIGVTSSGMFSVRTLEMLLRVTKMDRVIYSIDTPFNKSILGWKYLQELSEQSLLSKEELEMFSYGNAKRLLKLDLELQKT
ncbi:amidohydrolase 2 [Whalleya microplaca]|nr:amidohydrolase 2 [Whalleya microplaca]